MTETVDNLVDVSGKAEQYTRACGVGGTFARLSDARQWALIGHDVAGGTWLIRNVNGSWRVLSPYEQRQERELVTTR